jgi:hypothetical protein
MSMAARQAVAQLLEQIHGETRTLLSVDEQPLGEQGASGAQVRSYQVRSADAAGAIHTDRVVTKAATTLERRILHLLASQGCAVPPVIIPAVSGEERALVYMPFLAARPPLDLGHPDSPLTHAIADGLAGIHAANRLQPPAWLPHISEDVSGRLWLHAWRTRWHANLRDPEFAAEFGAYTVRLEAASERFLRTLDALTAEGATLTLLNVDLIPEHIRLWRGEARIIDWLYLDLPNYFTVETALVYRDALARHGYSISVVEFLERYHEVGRYMGLRYLGHALDLWAQGSAQRRQGRWFLYYTFSLALFGR